MTRLPSWQQVICYGSAVVASVASVALSMDLAAHLAGGWVGPIVATSVVVEVAKLLAFHQLFRAFARSRPGGFELGVILGGLVLGTGIVLGSSAATMAAVLAQDSARADEVLEQSGTLADLQAELSELSLQRASINATIDRFVALTYLSKAAEERNKLPPLNEQIRDLKGQISALQGVGKTSETPADVTPLVLGFARSYRGLAGALSLPPGPDDLVELARLLRVVGSLGIAVYLELSTLFLMALSETLQPGFGLAKRRVSPNDLGDSTKERTGDAEGKAEAGDPTVRPSASSRGDVWTWDEDAEATYRTLARAIKDGDARPSVRGVKRWCRCGDRAATAYRARLVVEGVCRADHAGHLVAAG